MKTSLIERIFGANWRTSLSGIGTAITGALTALAGLPYEQGGIAVMIPPDWKPVVFKWAGIATVILFIIKSTQGKDKQVAGNGTVQEPNKVPTESGGNRIV